jgi:hypothetical protein
MVGTQAHPVFSVGARRFTHYRKLVTFELSGCKNGTSLGDSHNYADDARVW